jgi:hypothetical protein
MASNLKYATALKNGKLDVVTSQLGASALLKIYDGTQPAGPGTAVTTQTLLATLTCNASAFAGSASGGVLTANAITGANASATGTASWFRVTTSGGTALIDGSVGISGADLIIDNASVNSGQAVSVTSLTITSGN